MNESTHRLNSYVLNPSTGQPYRAEVTVVIDPRSGRVVSGRVH